MKLITALLITFSLANGLVSLSAQGNNAHDYLKAIETAYKNTKVLAFDGNIKYYTSIQNTNPSEVMMMSYRRDGDKLHIVIGDQTTVYDGKLNIIINENERTIYVSEKQGKARRNLLPTEGFDQYLKTGLFEVKAEVYMGDKRKMSILSQDKSSASKVEFIYQPTSHFIEFSRMIIDHEDDETVGVDLNKKKFECSYYNYKTSLAEAISTKNYVETVKSNKKKSFRGLGKFKDFQVVII